MKEFTKEQLKDYVLSIINETNIIYAVKKGYTIAVQGAVGEEVITYEIDSEDNEYIERTGKVSLDKKTNKPAWILTKTDSDNKPVVNKYGHTNRYILSDSEFKERYNPTDKENLFTKSKIEKFIKLDEDISFETEEGLMVAKSGGYLMITNIDDISCISNQSFIDTYEIKKH